LTFVREVTLWSAMAFEMTTFSIFYEPPSLGTSCESWLCCLAVWSSSCQWAQELAQPPPLKCLSSLRLSSTQTFSYRWRTKEQVNKVGNVRLRALVASNLCRWIAWLTWLLKAVVQDWLIASLNARLRDASSLRASSSITASAKSFSIITLMGIERIQSTPVGASNLTCWFWS